MEYSVKSRPRCPHCNELLDRATSTFQEGQPDPGDFSICAYCNAILRYTEDMQLRIPSEDEFDSVPEELQQQILLIALAGKMSKASRINNS